MFEEPVELEFASSGHYCVKLLNQDIHSKVPEEEVLTVTENMSCTDIYSKEQWSVRKTQPDTKINPFESENREWV